MSIMTPASGLPVPTQGARVQVATVQGNWVQLPGIANVSMTGGEAPTRDVVTYQGTKQYVGNPTPGTVEIELSALVVAHDSYTQLMKAYREGQFMRFRWQYQDRLLRKGVTGAEVSIAMDGAVTFNTGANLTHPQWGVGNLVIGSVIRTGTSPNYRYDPVQSYTAAGVPTVRETTAAVSDAAYDVVGPPVYQPEFQGRVISFGRTAAPAQGELTTSLMIAPEDVLEDYKIGFIIS